MTFLECFVACYQMTAMSADSEPGKNFTSAGRTQQNLFFRSTGMPFDILL